MREITVPLRDRSYPILIGTDLHEADLTEAGVWEEAFRGYLRRRGEDLNDTHEQHAPERQEKAA